MRLFNTFFHETFFAFLFVERRWIVSSPFIEWAERLSESLQFSSLFARVFRCDRIQNISSFSLCSIYCDSLPFCVRLKINLKRSMSVSLFYFYFFPLMCERWCFHFHFTPSSSSSHCTSYNFIFVFADWVWNTPKKARRLNGCHTHTHGVRTPEKLHSRSFVYACRSAWSPDKYLWRLNDEKNFWFDFSTHTQNSHNFPRRIRLT